MGGDDAGNVITTNEYYALSKIRAALDEGASGCVHGDGGGLDGGGGSGGKLDG